MSNLTGKFALVGGSAGADWTFAGRAEESKVATGNRVRKKTLLAPYVMIALALIGVVDAFYDSYMIYTDQLLWCPPPIDGCNIVASSPYARIVGVPLGYFGLVFYLYMFGLRFSTPDLACPPRYTSCTSSSLSSTLSAFTV